MRLSSILINGVERLSVTLLRDFEVTHDSGDRLGVARMYVMVNPADAPNAIAAGNTIEIWKDLSGATGGDTAIFGEPLFGDPLFGDTTAQTIEFRGKVTLVEPVVMVFNAHGPTSKPLLASPLNELGGTRINLVHIEARDYSALLDSSTVQTGAYTSKTDQYIVQNLFGTALPSVNVTDVASTATLSTFDVREATLRDALSKLSDLTGAEWYIDSDDAGTIAFHYFLPSAKPASISLSETPDYSSSFPFVRSSFRVSKDWRTPCNSVVVVGQVGSGGTSIRRTRTDATSIATYGTYSRTVTDRQIKSNSEADARGDVELAKYANPQTNGTVVVHDRDYTQYQDLDVGQLLTITVDNTLPGFSGDYVIRRITKKWFNRDITTYSIEWGDYSPDAYRVIRRLYDLSQQEPAVQPTTPADGSVTNTSLTSDSVATTNIQNLAVTTGKINDLAVTNAKIANLTIDGDAKIANATISTAKIGLLQVTDALIAANISASKITTGVLLADLIGAGTILLGSGGLNIDGTAITMFRIRNQSATSRYVQINYSGMLMNDQTTGPTFQMAGPSSGGGLIITCDGSKSQIQGIFNSSLKFSIYSDSSTQYFELSGGQIIRGSGSPEGVVTANVGSLFIRSDGGAGTALYVKESGAGNTGWVAK